MAAPIADFTASAGLSVKFTDTSLNTPNAWAWNFGDNLTDTTQNPTHAFAQEGSYRVTLTVTNGDGSSTISRQIIASSASFNQSIGSMVQEVANMSLDEIYNIAQTWQLYLQPMMVPPILDADVFNELKWPPLANVLISKLVIYTKVMNTAKQVEIALGGSVDTSTSNSGNTAGADNVKYIETGPARTEWFDSSESISNIFKQGAGTNSGVFNAILQETCAYAQRLRIKLPMCTLARDIPTFIKGPCFKKWNLG